MPSVKLRAFKWLALKGARPQVALLTRGARGPASRFLPFASPLVRLTLKQKHRCGFLVLTQAKQFACSGQQKTLDVRGF